MMKKISVLIATVFLATFFVSCKSGVTLQQVRAQEKKAGSAVKTAQEEMLTLAKMKETYSEDTRDVRLKELKNRVDKIENDIDKLEDVSDNDNSNVKSGVNTAVTSLKNDKEALKKQIEALEAVKKENWSSSIETINQMALKLEQEIKRITANLPAA